jgi:hypothetical protein
VNILLVIKTASIRILLFADRGNHQEVRQLNVDEHRSWVPTSIIKENKKKKGERKITYLFIIVAKSDKTSDSLASGTFLA